MAENGIATLKEVRDFLEAPSKGFATEWKALTDEDRAQIRSGIGNGSLTY